MSEPNALLLLVRVAEAAREYRQAHLEAEDALRNPPSSSSEHYSRIERLDAAGQSLDRALADWGGDV